MNIERIKYAISIMEQAQNLRMGVWQAGRVTVDSIEDLHTCDNTACFAGYITVSPLFRKMGGKMTPWGTPKFEKQTHESAILAFLEMDEGYEALMSAIVYGATSNLVMGFPLRYQGGLKTHASDNEVRLLEQINELVGETPWNKWTPRHVIAILESLLRNEFEWVLVEEWEYD